MDQLLQQSPEESDARNRATNTGRESQLPVYRNVPPLRNGRAKTAAERITEISLTAALEISGLRMPHNTVT